MPNRMELPDDLNRLIEKREGVDRRAADAAEKPANQERRKSDRRQEGDAQGSDQSAEP